MRKQDIRKMELGPEGLDLNQCFTISLVILIKSMTLSDISYLTLIFPSGPVAKTLHSQCRASRFDQGTRFHMPQLSSRVATEDLSAATKIWYNQINKNKY